MLIPAILFAALLGTALICAYRRASLALFTLTSFALYLAYAVLLQPQAVWLCVWGAPLAVLVVLNIAPLRRAVLSAPLMRRYRALLPTMSATEREALEAGTVWWDGELFSGKPDWNKLMQSAAPVLSAEEQAFLDGPCETLCRMLDDWEITHVRGDLPPEVWAYLKQHGFFAMIIPKRYGGLQFSAYAHSCVLAKISSRSTTASSTVAVPNSLGPAELLLHYGTEKQKSDYLPRLASGEEIPCFALTGPRAGSDAASISDTGVICRGAWRGEQIIGINLNFTKRYITLAPVATVIGLAFRLFDPDHLMSEREDLGITCALISRDLPGISVGRRHYPLNIPFQNGPVRGENVFVPLDAIIGGFAMAGQGWRMLVEQLSVGRCISIPSSATGSALAGVFASGAYARLRRQFGTPIGRFEGIEQVLARMTGQAYIMDAARSVTAAAIDAGEKPAVPSAILKYHLTELARKVANDAMDLHGGKAICLGPNNYLGRSYQSVPIAITVEGANILTRSLIIFGQGAIRCHPYVLAEIEAAREGKVHAFDQALFSHIGFFISNGVRAAVRGFVGWPSRPGTTSWQRIIDGYSAAFAFAADVAMLSLGGSLKRREALSARLGDVLSDLYLMSMVLKHDENQGSPADGTALREWACRYLAHRLQETLIALIQNFPSRALAHLLRLCIFPRGELARPPSDSLGRDVAQLVMSPTATRERMSVHIYQTQEDGSLLGALQEALLLAERAEPIEKRIRNEGIKTGKIRTLDYALQIDQAAAAGIISDAEAGCLRDFDVKLMRIIQVDDFAPQDLVSPAHPTSDSTSDAGHAPAAVRLHTHQRLRGTHHAS